jgi:hypothetical protein
MGDLALEAPAATIVNRRVPAGSPGVAPGGPGPRVGVCVRELAGRSPAIPPEAAAELRGALAGALDGLVRDRAASIHLVPFRVRPKPGLRDDDAVAGEALAAAATTGARWIRHEAPPDTAAYGAIAAGLDVVVSVRLHGLVLAAAAGIPCVGLAYDSKVDGFLAGLGLGEQALPLDATGAAIRAAIDRALSDPTLGDRMAGGVAAARARTAELIPMLAAIVGRRPAPAAAAAPTGADR